MKKKNKIFILEDCAIQRKEIMSFIDPHNREFIYASSFKEAKNIYNENISAIDLFIIDIQLPDGNGIDFLKDVRKSLNASPAIVTSNVITENVIEISKKLGIIELFEKPLEIDELNQAVMNLLAKEDYYKSQIKKGI